jgi:hypothetical protein
MRNDPPDCALASTSSPLYQKEEMEGGTGYLLENQQRYTEKRGAIIALLSTYIAQNYKNIKRRSCGDNKDRI